MRNQTAIAQVPASVEALVDCCRRGGEFTIANAAGALANLAERHTDNKRAIGDTANAVATLVKVACTRSGCFTAALLLLYYCGCVTAALLLHVRVPAALLLLYYCFTTLSRRSSRVHAPASCCCVPAALLLLYYCFTTALLHRLHAPASCRARYPTPHARSPTLQV
jgi:hypothetical protein